MTNNLIYMWKGENIEPMLITPTRKWRIFNQNILVQFLRLDNCPLFLALKMTNSVLTFEDLCNLLEKTGFLRMGEDVKEQVSLALDTLLDIGMFKAEWREDQENTFQRYFINRNELLNPFANFKEKITQKLKDINFIEDTRKLYSLIHLEEAYEIVSEDRYFENRIFTIEQDFIQFIKNYILKTEHEILHPIARKAWSIFEHLREMHQNEVEWNIPIEYNVFSERLKGKKVCVFDDAVERGRSFCKVLDNMLEAGLDPQNIILVAYIVNKKDYFDSNNEYRKKILKTLKRDIVIYKALDDLEFHRKVADILMYIASFGSIIDYDHLIIATKLAEPMKCVNVMKTLKKLNIGKILEPGNNLQYLHVGKKKITIDDVNYRTLVNEELPESVQKISQCKIRMIWEYDKEKFTTEKVILTPIINPVVINKIKMGLKCKKIPSLKFCDLLDSYPILQKYNLCVDCTIFHMITRLLEKFFSVFANATPVKLEIKPQNIKWVEFESKYDNITPIKRELESFKQKICRILPLKR